MDFETANRLREQRAYRRAQIAERWQERVMRELKRQGSSQKGKEEAPQKMKGMEGQVGPQHIGGVTKEVQQMYRSLAQVE